MEDKDNNFLYKIKTFFKLQTIYSKIIIAFVIFAVVILFFMNLTITSTITHLEESLIANRLIADINYIEDIINEGNRESNWKVRNGAIYFGDVMIGDGTEEHANIAPFLEHESKTGTLSYVFILDSNAKTGFVEETRTAEGYMEGHYKRVAGSTKSPDGKSIVGTYITKNVSDALDKYGEFSGEANVAGGLIFCRYETLRDEDGKIIGAIVVGRGIEELKKQISGSVNNITAFMIVIVILCCVIIVLILSKWISSISVITDYLRGMKNGIMPEKELRLNTKDEMSMISESINQMVHSLKENKVLRKKSETDALTGLPNRFAYDYYSNAIYDAMMKNPHSIAFEILDIDYFKQYNDNYGHQAGDQCIKQIADVIQELCDSNKNIFSCRYGGDEFVLIYNGYTLEQIEEFVKLLKRKVAECAIEHKYSKVSDIVSVTQGVCFGHFYPHHKIEHYFYRADQALYEVKKVSRNHYRIEVI